jgi:plasmid stability protein
MKGQLSRSADARQASVEDRLYSLGTALAILEHDELRVRQAISRREEMRELLTPVLTDIERVRRSILAAQAQLGHEFQAGQANNWDAA